MKTRLNRMLAVLLLPCSVLVLAQNTTNNPSPAAQAASTGAPGTVGALSGVSPTSGVGTDAGAPKLQRGTPGNTNSMDRGHQPVQGGARAASGAASGGK